MCCFWLECSLDTAGSWLSERCSSIHHFIFRTYWSVTSVMSFTFWEDTYIWRLWNILLAGGWKSPWQKVVVGIHKSTLVVEVQLKRYWKLCLGSVAAWDTVSAFSGEILLGGLLPYSHVCPEVLPSLLCWIYAEFTFWMFLCLTLQVEMTGWEEIERGHIDRSSF